jgi:7-carboxy-7-deazaguanine synthase
VSYAIKEMFYSLQGEGRQTGRPAVFVRFAGCNLWTGREADRPNATCRFCDTDFVGMDGTYGGRYDAAGLVAIVEELWGERAGVPFAVCTGGEPALQLDSFLVEELHRRGFEVAVETNGTRPLPENLDWVCVSPKAGTTLVTTTGDELKVVYPQEELDLVWLESLDFRCFSLQPMDGDRSDANLRACVRLCLERPRWSLSLQTHKLLGIR